MKNVIRRSILFALFVGIGIIVSAGDGYENIVKDNMVQAGMTKEQAERALSLPRTLEDVIIFDVKSSQYFAPPFTLVLIADDGMSGHTIEIKDTLWFRELFNLWNKIEE